MAEFTEGKRIFTLLEVSSSIQRTLASRYTSSFWIKAEMNKLNYYPHSGHCYPDLVEKVNGKVIAQMKSTLWKDDYARINENFLSVVKAPLKEGIRMLFCAKITFDPVYGLALRITDIDPVFSLGELEREKQECIARLREEGIFDRNRSLTFPLLPQRLAVISVQTSKGYADFNKVIDGNPWGYKFFHVLFPSLLQGDRAAGLIRYQMERIRKVITHFDVVAIIRGGGGDVGLSCFNDLALSRDIALFPIPVLTGIGHATNETVVEMVSYKNAITPTALAEYLLQKFHLFSEPVNRAEEILVNKARQVIADERHSLFHAVKYFRSVADNVLIRSHHEIRDQARDLFRQSNLNILRQKQLHDTLIYSLRKNALSLCKDRASDVIQSAAGLRKMSSQFVKQGQNALTNLTKAIANMHPDNVLKRGYTITRVNGKIVTGTEQIKPSDQLETILSDGTAHSTVNSVKKSSGL